MEHFLSIPILIFIPMIISLIMLTPWFKLNEIHTNRFVKILCFGHFLYCTLFLLFYNSAQPYNTIIHLLGSDWIQTLGVKISFRLDNISLIMVTLTSFIFLISSFISKSIVNQNHKFYYSMFLLLMSAILGIFSSNDIFLFFMFWELELIPAYFLIGNRWKQEVTPEESEKAKKSAIKFVLFTFAGSMFLLLGILLINFYSYLSTGILNANLTDLDITTIPNSIKLLISICFIISFGVKIPIIPIHTWLPDAHTNAITPISIILAGILLKTGSYGLFRFNYELLHNTFLTIAPYLAIFALINIIYTAFVAFAQNDIKRIVAYSSISNMGLIVLGFCTCNKIGVSAAFFHTIAHSLVTAGLFAICGIVYNRCKTRDINILSGIASKMPVFFGIATTIVIASIGIPLFAPFVGEILTITAALNSGLSPVIRTAGICSLPLLILSSCYMLKFLHAGFLGEERNEFSMINDISSKEGLILGIIVLGLILFGIIPSIGIDFINLG